MIDLIHLTFVISSIKLEQIERLRSEIPPPPHDYQYYWVKLDPKCKDGKVKFTNLKNLPDSEVAW